MKYLSIDHVLTHIRGGPARLRNLLRKHGQPVPALTNISKWKQRRSIPSLWSGAVIWACAREGIDPLLLLEEYE